MTEEERQKAMEDYEKYIADNHAGATKISDSEMNELLGGSWFGKKEDKERAAALKEAGFEPFVPNHPAAGLFTGWIHPQRNVYFYDMDTPGQRTLNKEDFNGGTVREYRVEHRSPWAGKRLKTAADQSIDDARVKFNAKKKEAAEKTAEFFNRIVGKNDNAAKSE